ncbi:MAG: RND family efflux transporter MFP subunit [Desulforhopalus sp.]|jgi:RND family efflux transporter MFP subunit
MDPLIQSWLLTLSKTVQGVVRAVVVKDSAPASHVLAQIPEDIESIDEFQSVIDTVLAKKKTVFHHNVDRKNVGGEPLDIVASPLFGDRELYGAVVLYMSTRVTGRQQIAVQQVENAAVWLETMCKQRSKAEKGQLVTVVELVAACLEHDNFQAAATDVLSDLVTSFSCERVSLGVCKGQDIVVEAVSHSGGFDRRSNLIQATSAAMGEATEQNQTIKYPKEDRAVYYTRCHEALTADRTVEHVLTVPFVVDGKIAGAILIESMSGSHLDSVKIDQIEQIVSLIGPVLEVRYQNEQWLLVKASNAAKGFFAKFVGHGNLGLKLVTFFLAVVLLFLSLYRTDYRVTGRARLEAKNQRVIVAPQDGYIAESNVRSGDIIHKGELLAKLDDKDLYLQRQKWLSQLEQLRREYREALAQHDRSKVNIIQSRLRQAGAQINLVEEQLVRSRFIAPFDGIVVSGDLSQALGVPVERGQVLFTVAPLIAYRVVLMVDERDIGSVKKAQPGELVLSSMPENPMVFTVDSITPVSKLEGGRNYFQVEAKITESSEMLRPGMEGVGKIVIEPRKLLWIWSHRIVDWFRLAFWSLKP